MEQSHQLNPEAISGLVGLAIAFCLHFFPRLNTAWDGLDSTAKRLILGSLCIVAAWAIALVNCQYDAQCALLAGDSVIRNAFLAWGGSQAMYALIREMAKRGESGPQ